MESKGRYTVNDEVWIKNYNGLNIPKNILCRIKDEGTLFQFDNFATVIYQATIIEPRDFQYHGYSCALVTGNVHKSAPEYKGELVLYSIFRQED